MADLQDAADASAAAKMIKESHAVPSMAELPHLANEAMAVVRARLEDGLDISVPIEPQDAFLMTIHLDNVRGHRFWTDNRRVTDGPLKRGDRLLIDLCSDPTASVCGSFDALHFYLPRKTLTAALGEESKAFTGLDLNRWEQDPVLLAFAQLMTDVLGREGNVAQTVFEEAGLAMMWHILEQSTSGLPGSGTLKGLNASSLANAYEMLAENMSLDRISNALGLSGARFIRSFKAATGMTPAEWKRAHRIDEAKRLLFGSDLPIGAIAGQCGFSDKSHLVRSFHQATGHTPSGWRKARWM